MFAAEMPTSSALDLTLSEWKLGVLDGMTGGKRHPKTGSVVGNFSVIPNKAVPNGFAWANWGKPARLRTLNDLVLPSGIHNPHALLTLLPNISLSIYKGLP
jgi:hypothetical protein